MYNKEESVHQRRECITKKIMYNGLRKLGPKNNIPEVSLTKKNIYKYV